MPREGKGHRVTIPNPRDNLAFPLEAYGTASDKADLMKRVRAHLSGLSGHPLAGGISLW